MFHIFGWLMPIYEYLTELPKTKFGKSIDFILNIMV